MRDKWDKKYDHHQWSRVIIVTRVNHRRKFLSLDSVLLNDWIEVTLEPRYGYFRRSLSRDDRITIVIKFDNVSRAMTAKKSAEKCAACSEFLLCLFSRFHRPCGYAELTSSVTRPRQTIVDMRRFSQKDRLFDGYHTTKSTSAGTHTQRLTLY